MPPGEPESILVGDAAGYIQSSADGGRTWQVTNEPATGENFSSPDNVSGGLWDLVAPPAAAVASGLRHSDGFSLQDPPLTQTPLLYSPVKASADLAAGAGEFAGNLAAAPAGHPQPSPLITAPVVPSITAFRLTNGRFAVASGSTPTRARASSKGPRRKPRTPRGSAFGYTLTVASTATIVIARRSTGKRVGGRCVAPNRANAHARACTLYTIIQSSTPGRLVAGRCVPQTRHNGKKKRCAIVRPAGTLTRISHAGANTAAFTGRIGHAALSPGTYRATITARIGSGASSNSLAAMFTIVRG